MLHPINRIVLDSSQLTVCDPILCNTCMAEQLQFLLCCCQGNIASSVTNSNKRLSYGCVIAAGHFLVEVDFICVQHT